MPGPCLPQEGLLSDPGGQQDGVYPGHQEGLPEAGSAAPSRQKPGRPQSAGQVRGPGGGVRGEREPRGAVFKATLVWGGRGQNSLGLAAVFGLENVRGSGKPDGFLIASDFWLKALEAAFGCRWKRSVIGPQICVAACDWWTALKADVDQWDSFWVLFFFNLRFKIFVAVGVCQITMRTAIKCEQ